MELTAIIARVKQASQDRIVNIKSTNVIHRLAKMEPHAMNKITTTNVTALMGSMENNVKIMSIGVHKILAITERLVVKRKTISPAIALQAGRARCVT